MWYGCRPVEGGGRADVGRVADAREQDGNCGVVAEERMTLIRSETASKYDLIGEGQGDVCRFSMGVGAARPAREVRRR